MDSKKQLKLSNTLVKLNEVTDAWVELPELLEYFDISEEEAHEIQECHKRGHGIEGQIYGYSDLHYAYHALTLCELNNFMTESQILHAMYWIKTIYLALMRRTPKKSTPSTKQQHGNGNRDGEDSGEEDAENSENDDADR